jgi:hypothetical protein
VLASGVAAAGAGLAGGGACASCRGEIVAALGTGVWVRNERSAGGIRQQTDGNLTTNLRHGGPVRWSLSLSVLPISACGAAGPPRHG